MRARGYLTPLVMVAGGVRFTTPPASADDRLFLASLETAYVQDEFGLGTLQLTDEQKRRYWALTAPTGAQA